MRDTGFFVFSFSLVFRFIYLLNRVVIHIFNLKNYIYMHLVKGIQIIQAIKLLNLI